MKFASALLLFAMSIIALSSARDIPSQKLPIDISEDTIPASDEKDEEIPSASEDEPSAPKGRALSPRKSGCSVTIANLGISAQPLFLQPGTSQQWEVSASGDMELDVGDSLELFCSSTFANPSGKSGSQTATCVSGLDFKIGKTTYNIAEVTCSSWPEFTTRKIGAKCNGGELYESGFPVGNRFVKQLEFCFNEDEEVTRYVKHSLSPSNNAFQSNVPRLGFTKGGMYGRKNVEKLYAQAGQTKTLSTVIGKNAEKYIQVKDTFYLARGHLAAKADFIFATEQRGTFLFGNSAPQWQSFNAGNWQRVEDNTRTWVAKKNIKVDCVTGTYGVTTLPNEKGIETPLYLDYDKNKNGLIAVPMLYYRVITEPATKRGVVLLGVNNPYLTKEQLKKDYIICKDISDKLDFLTWKKDDMKAGYSYACEVNDFAKNNPYLPKFDVKSLLN